MADDPPSTRAVVIGLDVGTSSVKAVAFGDGDEVLASAHEGLRTLPSAARNHDEQDPAEIRSALRAALASVADSLGRARVDPRRTAAIGVAAAMHGVVGLDGGGAAVTPLLTWADGRATDVALTLRSAPEAAGLHEATGTPIHPMSPLTKLRWFADHDPTTASTVRRWVGLKELVFADLTGAVASDESSASATGLWSLRERGWHAPALRVARVDASDLPPVLPTTDHRALVRPMATATGLRPQIPVVVGAGDGPTANLGVGAVEPGVAALSIGTSAALRVTTDRPTIGDGDLFCYALDDRRFVVGGALSTGGNVTDWAAATFAAPLGIPTGPGSGEPVPDELVRALLDEAAAVAPGSDGLVVVPRLHPERAPSWDPTRTGEVHGLTARHGRGHLVRAAMEGVAAQVAEVLVAIERATGPVHVIRATGGAFAHPLWRDVVARALDRELVLVDDGHGTARGAARIARSAFDSLRSLEDQN